uniref:Uncharacterized protein n=1 Tax=Rhizophora mucronata TaxID=61149 RepID=A0A2P2N7J2_RHIMU
MYWQLREFCALRTPFQQFKSSYPLSLYP